MADDEQFSLCWNNFNSNLSAGFHESLCRGDLVDVTLAAEGQFVKAHRLVLSVCSPYFRKMFTQMPANQHAFVFLKDVSHTALKDLIQFMYCGEVNVKQEALPAFISTAEALQIKGLTDSDPPPSQSPAEPSTPSPQIQQISSPRVRQRTSTSRSFKIESVDDSGDDKQTQIVIQTTAAPAAQQVVAQPQTQHLQTQSQTHIAPQQIATTTTATTTTVVTHKRPARSVGSGPHIKRTKSTIDPLDTTDVSTGTQQITVQTAVVAAPAPETKTQVQQQQSEPEYIDLPIELPTKSEPDYAEDAGDVDGGENETTYVEDDSYGELRYDESYFTENDDTPAGATTVQTGTGSGGGVNATTSKALVKQQQSSFTDTSYVDVADQGNSDAQDSMRTFQYSITNCKFEMPCGDESFLPILTTLHDSKNISAEGKALKVKTGLSKRKPLFLENRTLDDWGAIKYSTTSRGNKLLSYEGHRFIKNNIYGMKVYWKCTKWHSNCKARAITSFAAPTRCVIKGVHNHSIVKEE
ncbi:PREDICTED: modifier of mdg4-like isoform X8 [Bactrocera latifrons]|uniref:modifier of mdg4-like isoform X8 n=1 Tax=Bactrocera latifrons TaxID=174628 RepID=UPI0008DCE6E0|nr:PREDICTED: modifier of mdg4-like isoform X8 [Bactrocera latifrons]